MTQGVEGAEGRHRLGEAQARQARDVGQRGRASGRDGIEAARHLNALEEPPAWIFVTAHDEHARRWKISITPTLLFFGPGGREIAERMEGAYQPDFYGPYLEDRLSRSRAVVKG